MPFLFGQLNNLLARVIAHAKPDQVRTVEEALGRLEITSYSRRSIV